jgi:UDP-glucose 4-epimerase
MGIFIGNVIRGEPIVIHGDGEQSRDFVYVADVIDAWLQAWDNTATYGQMFNIGTGTRRSINELAAAVLSVFNYSPETYPIKYAPRRPGDQRHMVADIAKSQQVLGWQPRCSFEDGLARTVRWAMAQRHGEDTP